MGHEGSRTHLRDDFALRKYRTPKAMEGCTMAPRQLDHPRPRTTPLKRWGLAAFEHDITRGLLRALSHPRSPDDYLQALHPDWTLDRVVARIVAVEHETRDTTSLYLHPSRNWRPHRAGQHVLLTVTLAGVQHTRCFSLSAAHRADAPLRLTIKAHDGGRVSCWARDDAAEGDRVQLSQPQGEFVLPDPLPSGLLFVSGGSGMTPLLAMAQALAADGYRGSLRWLHSEHGTVALASEMSAACRALDTTLDVHDTADPDSGGLLTAADIAARVPDHAERHLLTCGPPGLMDAASALYLEAGRANQVHHEDFQPRRAGVFPLRARGDDAPQLMLERSRRAIRVESDASLLELAEQAGLHPPHGCRRGICHTCKCTKRSGTVVNMLTGAESDACNEEIQLCIHSPVTDVTLDL